MRILFVCTGNTCRSVMAEWLLRYKLASAGIKDVNVESAGIYAMDGLCAAEETLKVLSSLGIDASLHRTRVISDKIINDADLILALGQNHVGDILQRVPNAANKVHLLRTYGLTPKEYPADISVSDPVGRPFEVYEICLSVISESVDRVLEAITGRES